MKKDGSYLREMVMMYSVITINFFVNSNMITNRKAEIPMNFLTNARSKIVDKVRVIPVAGQENFHPDMIANVLSMN